MKELYLTHFTTEKDYLVDLIEEFGFIKVATKNNGEEVFVKKLIISRKDIEGLNPIQILENFYPNFYDGKEINKFLISILPDFHRKLFTDYRKRQPQLGEYFGEFIIEGNAIKKVYLTHSNIRKIKPGDIIIFYRSKDQKALTTLGVIEKIYFDQDDLDEVMRIVSKRTVYSKDEIAEILEKPTTIILFRQLFHFKKLVNLESLRNAEILSMAPPSIRKIKHKDYIFIKNEGGIDKRFTFD